MLMDKSKKPKGWTITRLERVKDDVVSHRYEAQMVYDV